MAPISAHPYFSLIFNKSARLWVKKNYCLYHPCYNTTIPPCPYTMHCIHVTTMSCKPYTAFSSPKTLPSWPLYYIPCHPYAQALRCPLLCNALPPSHQLLQYDLISCRFMHCYYVLCPFSLNPFRKEFLQQPYSRSSHTPL